MDTLVYTFFLNVVGASTLTPTYLLVCTSEPQSTIFVLFYQSYSQYPEASLFVSDKEWLPLPRYARGTPQESTASAL